MFFIKCTSFWVLRQPSSCFCGEREKGFLAGESRRRSSSPRVFHLPGDQIRLRCGHTWCASLPARDSETLSRGSRVSSLHCDDEECSKRQSLVFHPETLPTPLPYPTRGRNTLLCVKPQTTGAVGYSSKP